MNPIETTLAKVKEIDEALVGVREENARLYAHIAAYHRIVSKSMAALHMVRRTHKKDCTRAPKASDEECSCGTDELNSYLERMAWEIRHLYLGLLDEEQPEWDSTVVWTEEPLPRGPEWAIDPSLS